jgi:Gpi18-like mannosyltransferase
MPGDEEAVVGATQITGPVADQVSSPAPADVHTDPTPGTQPGWRPSLEDLGPRARAWWKRNQHGLLVAMVGTIGLRVVTEWIGLVSQFGVNFPHEVARRPYLLSQVWGHWDAAHYLSIAQNGYAGKVVGHGQAIGDIAFAPLYPAGIRLVHAVTPLNWEASAELLSALALFVSLAALHRLATIHGDRDVGAASTMVLLAFPTAFFLLAPYPESLGLALITLALLSAESDRWLLAGVLAAAATMTKYYLIILAVALCVEVWRSQRVDHQGGSRRRWIDEALPYMKLTVPSLLVFVGWMIYQKIHLGDPLAFVHAQAAEWNRHFAAPWTLAHRTASDMIHLRFLDTSTASVTELFDTVTILILAGAAIYVFLRTSRTFGVLLGLAFCVFTFQALLSSVTREVLVFAPLFLALGTWTARRRWLERVLLVLFIPCGYFLIQRFVTGSFAG